MYFCNRPPREAADVFLLVGGYVDGIISADVHTLDLSDSGSVCDKKLPDLPSPSYGVAGMTTEDGRPLVCGGYGVGRKEGYDSQ